MPFIVYADLEAILKKTEEEKKYQHHQVFSIAYYVHCAYDSSLSMYRFRRDKDCVAWFATELENLAHDVKVKISSNVPMPPLSKQQEEEFHSAKYCHICEIPLAQKRNDKQG